jgi:hypothetical protein
MNTKGTVRSICFLFSLFLIFFLGALAYGQGTIDSIAVTPTNPSTEDEITIQVKGTVPDSCYEVTTSPSLDGCGVRLNFLMTRRSGCFSFPKDPVDWKKTAHVIPLPAGNYTIAAELRDTEDTPQDSMTTSFFVLDYSDITQVQIIQVRSSLLTNLHVEDTLTLMVDAIGPEEATLLYRFFYKFGYGTPAWETSTWERVQDWSSSNSVEYSFTEAGNYYVIGHVKAEDGDWAAGDPQGGFVVAVEE